MATPQPNKNTKRIREIARAKRPDVIEIPVLDFCDDEITKVEDVGWPSQSQVPKPALGLVYVLRFLPPWTRALVVLAVIALLAFAISHGIGVF